MRISLIEVVIIAVILCFFVWFIAGVSGCGDGDGGIRYINGVVFLEDFRVFHLIFLYSEQ